MSGKSRLYGYIGPPEKLASSSPTRHRIDSLHDLQTWFWDVKSEGMATFVIDEQGALWLADRRSEHVACADGRPVRSAGEMFFEVDAESSVRLAEVSNQSTGYCPEQESWLEVAAALDRLGVAHPGCFTQVCLFRRCLACGQRNLVKEGDFTCAVCASPLPAQWNF